ncbi:MAG: mechanosensitive ion channel domain-containing protein [Desulforhopalus sp.]
MNLITSCRFFITAFLTSLFLILPGQAQSSEPPSDLTEISLQDIAPEKIDSVLAKLSDEQVRSLLVRELQTKSIEQSKEKTSRGGLLPFVVGWLRLVDVDDSGKMESQLAKISSHTTNVPAHLAKTLHRFSDDSPSSSTWMDTIILLFVFLLALAVEKVFNTATSGFHRQFLEQAIPQLKGLMRFWAGILHALPSLISLIVFSGSVFFFFMLSPLSSAESFRLLFMALLFVILFARIATLLCRIIFAPQQPSFRLLDIGDAAAQNLYRIVCISLYFLGGALGLIALLKELGMNHTSFVLLIIVLGTLFLLLLGFFVMRHRQTVADSILSDHHSGDESGWVVRQFAALWYVLALLYLFVVWLNFLYMQLSGTGQDNGALLLSLLAVPIFLLVDRIGQWVVQNTIGALRIYTTEAKEEKTSLSDQAPPGPAEKEKLLVIRVGRVVRFAILFAITIWVLRLWNYHIPYATAVTRAVFESLVTLAVALLFWRIASAYIERKIAAATPETTEEAEESEWGGGAQKGRSYTLLPMVRKCIGTVLTIMVTLIILSSIGVNIGPLLAGAGVVGLAVGFGAQKLVSDVLSGFFYLLDDAFRVGEYLQTGNISGAVENITLRNVMLRHHRGMLQIVPYSELGTITNFMRGGIVVKFNLEFPYDTDVDQVRKIIKKVGQSMLAEDAFKDDFLQPVKSQGVREITNSIMVIRVKFTAKPGAHFLIRREAYRRITEALMAKGIHYAHRKVIVELPESQDMPATDRQKIAEAGAAAGLATLAEEKNKDDMKGASPGMPEV